MKAPNPPITITADAMFLTVSTESPLVRSSQSFRYRILLLQRETSRNRCERRRSTEN